MKLPSLSLVMTIHERPGAVIRAVRAGVYANGTQPNQVVICFDRSSRETVRAVYDEWRLAEPDTVELCGPPGWRGPAKAWNAALARVSSELTMMISSEVAVSPDSIARMREFLATRQAVLFGKCTDSSGTQQVTGFPPGLLCSSEYPRPLGFVWCVPTWALRAIGGYDEGYMKGLCYDDDDISYRLWKLGLPFVFHDGVSGVHQFHERPGLRTKEGIAKTAINRAYIRAKFSSDGLPEPKEAPMNALYHAGRVAETRKKGITIWQMRIEDRARLPGLHVETPHKDR